MCLAHRLGRRKERGESRGQTVTVSVAQRQWQAKPDTAAAAPASVGGPSGGHRRHRVRARAGHRAAFHCSRRLRCRYCRSALGTYYQEERGPPRAAAAAARPQPSHAALAALARAANSDSRCEVRSRLRGQWGRVACWRAAGTVSSLGIVGTRKSWRVGGRREPDLAGNHV
jgi:hypothetical protein